MNNNFYKGRKLFIFMIFAASILAINDVEIERALVRFRKNQTETVLNQNLE